MNPKELEIQKIFNSLVKNKIGYIVLRGFSDIPENVSIDNDLDLICHLEQKQKIKTLFKELNYKYYEDSRESNSYLYHAQPHEHFYCKKRDLHFDIVYSLAYKSPNKGEWVSVHQEIQDSIWENKIKNDYYWLYQPDNTDLAIHLICHSIFDKKKFKQKHIEQLEKVLPYVNCTKYAYLLKLVFFEYTPYLMEMIEEKNYDEIITNYLQFKEY